MTQICIARALCVPESRFCQRTPSQTRPSPPGDAQTRNVDSTLAARASCLPVPWLPPSAGPTVRRPPSARGQQRGEPYSAHTLPTPLARQSPYLHTSPFPVEALISPPCFRAFYTFLTFPTDGRTMEIRGGASPGFGISFSTPAAFSRRKYLKCPKLPFNAPYRRGARLSRGATTLPHAAIPLHPAKPLRNPRNHAKSRLTTL